ncbi:MAG: hypothetical protein DRJ03_26130 [Chloroflexi bacterium]|nr:MAG: hypothetical protein DRJ03_26130 [Chloroflexota bacterium]
MLFELLQEIQEFKRKHPKTYEANKHHFEEIIKRLREIIREVFEYFDRYPRRSVCTIALFTNNLARWRRSEICIKVIKQDDGSFKVKIYKGYKLDKLNKVNIESGYTTDSAWYSREIKYKWLK